MSVARLTKHQQSLLCGTWETMPLAVRRQLTQETVRDVEIDPRSISEAVSIIAERRDATRCKARWRRLDTLLNALT